MTNKFVPDFTISGGRPLSVLSEPGVGPAQNAWPPNAGSAASASFTPASWLQPTWFVDPQNVTGNASDDNRGDNASFPVMTYNGGIVSKWGTTAPILRQNTTITWLSSQPVGGADPVIAIPICVGVVLIMNAALPVATHAGILAGLVAKNQSTGQVLTANLGFAAIPGQLVRNTTAGKDSFAWVWQNVAGTTFKLSQPLVPSILPLQEGAFPAEVDTWADGDAFAVYDLISVNVTHASGNAAMFDAIDNFPAPVQIHHINIASPDGLDSDNNFSAANIAVIECSTNCVVDDAPDFASDYISSAQNCFFGSSITSRADQWVMYGGVARSQLVGSVIPWSFGFGVILDNTSGVGCVIGGPMGQGQGVPYLLDVYIAGVIDYQNMLDAAQVAAGPAHIATVVWGPGTLNGIGVARLRYASANTATGTFLNAGGLTLNSKSSTNTFDPSTGAWAGPIAITPAHLDTTIGLGGFDGLAANVGGASIAVGAL